MLKPEITDTSAQGLFDYVVAHLRKQGKPASKKDGTCWYRTADGLACAVGCLITDETAIEWDGRDDSALGSLIRDRMVTDPVILQHSAMLERLQVAHDTWPYEVNSRAAAAELNYLERNLRDIAFSYDLVYIPRPL